MLKVVKGVTSHAYGGGGEGETRTDFVTRESRNNNMQFTIKQKFG